MEGSHRHTRDGYCLSSHLNANACVVTSTALHRSPERTSEPHASGQRADDDGLKAPAPWGGCARGVLSPPSGWGGGRMKVRPIRGRAVRAAARGSRCGAPPDRDSLGPRERRSAAVAGTTAGDATARRRRCASRCDCLKDGHRDARAEPFGRDVRKPVTMCCCATDTRASRGVESESLEQRCAGVCTLRRLRRGGAARAAPDILFGPLSCGSLARRRVRARERPGPAIAG